MNQAKVWRVAALLGFSWSLMGASSCNQTAAPPRTFARKVEMGAVTAPNIVLPANYGGTFNFALVASSQMEGVLGSTTYFSNANINPNGNYSPAGLAQAISSDFSTCTPSVPPNQVPSSAILPVTAASLQASKIKTATVGVSNQSYYGSCLIDVPQATVTTSINDFSLTDGGGLTLTSSSLGTLGGASFSFADYALQVEMVAKNPLDVGNSTIAATISNTYTTSGSASLTLNLGPFSLGPSGYFQTPLAQVTQTGLTSAVTDLYNKWTSSDPWYAMVLKACDTYIYINGSKEMGLQVGDVVEIKNVMYMWDGDVCSSQWAGDVPDVTPVAYAQIVSLGDNISAAQVIKGNAAYPHANTTIYPGARIYMYQTAQAVAGVAGLPVPPAAATPAPAPAPAP